MRRNVGFITLGVICLLAIAAAVAVKLSRNTDGPVIKVDQSVIITEYSDDDEVLLKGVSAHDEKDGDLSDEVLVEHVVKLTNGQQMLIKYVVVDSDNNTTHYNRVITFGIAGEQELITYDVENSSTKKQEDLTKQDETTKPDDSATEKPTNKVESPTTSKPVEQSTTANGDKDSVKPVITLTESEITLHIGEPFKWSKYVNEITDNKDDRATLFTRINVANLQDVDTNKVGDYVVKYYVADSDGNISEKIPLTIHVVE